MLHFAPRVGPLFHPLFEFDNMLAELALPGGHRADHGLEGFDIANRGRWILGLRGYHFHDTVPCRQPSRVGGIRRWQDEKAKLGKIRPVENLLKKILKPAVKLLSLSLHGRELLTQLWCGHHHRTEVSTLVRLTLATRPRKGDARAREAEIAEDALVAPDVVS